MRVMAEPFDRKFMLGEHINGNVSVRVNWDGARLSLTGDCGGNAGQITDVLREDISYAPGWTPELIDRLAEVWDRWHLNHMRAGCEHQRSEGWSQRPIDPAKPLNAYGLHFPGQQHESWNMLTWVRRAEHPEGLLTEPCSTCGYRYGSAWLKEDVPAEVLDFLSSLLHRSLPAATTSYPWRG